jgi:hypothetical protein
MTTTRFLLDIAEEQLLDRLDQESSRESNE